MRRFVEILILAMLFLVLVPDASAEVVAVPSFPGFDEISQFEWVPGENVFRFNDSLEGFSFDIEVTVFYEGEEKTYADIKNAFPGLDIADYVDYTVADGYKFALTFSNISPSVAQGIDKFRFKVVDWNNLDLSDVKLDTNSSTISIRGGYLLINYSDLVEANYTLMHPELLVVDVFGDSQHYVNGTISLDPTVTSDAQDADNTHEVMFLQDIHYSPLRDRVYVLVIDDGYDLNIYSADKSDLSSWTHGAEIDNSINHRRENHGCVLDSDASNEYLHCAWTDPGTDDIKYVRIELTGSSPFVSVGTVDTAYDASAQGQSNLDDTFSPRVGLGTDDCVIIVFAFRDDSEASADEWEIVVTKEGGTCGDGDWDAGADTDGSYPIYSIQSEAGYNDGTGVGIVPYGSDGGFQLYWKDTDDTSSYDFETAYYNSTADTVGVPVTLEDDAGGTTSVQFECGVAISATDQSVGFSTDDASDDLDAYQLDSRTDSTVDQVDTGLNVNEDYGGMTAQCTAVVDTGASGNDDVWLFSPDGTDRDDIYLVNSTDGGSTWGTPLLWQADVGASTVEKLSSVFNSEDCQIYVTWYNDGGSPESIEVENVSTGSCTGGDVDPPVISSVVNWSITNESVKVNWSTDEASNSSVSYGTSPSSLGSSVGGDSDVTTHSVTLTGLSNNTQYYYNVTSCDASDNCQTNGTFSFITSQNDDTTPPASVTGLNETQKGTAWILWNWTNPATDFDHVEVYLDGVFKVNTSNGFYNATGLNASAEYLLSTRTADSSGNVNTSWVNDTATTESGPSGNATLSVVLVTPSSDANVTQNEFFSFTVNVTCSSGSCGDVNATLDPRSDTHTAEEAGGWRVEWFLVRDASNKKVYDVSVQNLMDVNRDFDLRVLIDQFEGLDVNIDLYEWKEVPRLDSAGSSDTTSVNTAQWKPAQNPSKFKGNTEIRQDYGMINLPKFGSKAKLDDAGSLVTGNGVKKFRVELSDFNPILYNARLGFLEKTTNTLFHPMIISTEYEADFLSDFAASDYHVLNSNYLTNRQIEGAEHNETDVGFSGSNIVEAVLSHGVLDPNDATNVPIDVQATIVDVGSQNGDRVIHIDSQNTDFGGQEARYNFPQFAAADVSDGFNFSFWIAPDGDDEEAEFGLCGGLNCSSGKVAYIEHVNGAGRWDYDTDVIAQATLSSQHNDDKWHFFIIRVNRTAKTVDFFIYNATDIGQVDQQIGSATGKSYSADIRHFFLSGFNHAGFWYWEVDDVVYGPNLRTGRYLSKTFNTGGNHSQFTPKFSCTGTCIVNLTVEGELFSNVVSGTTYSLTTGAGDGNTTFNYTVEFSDSEESTLTAFNISFDTNIKSGAVSTTAGDVPFYTTDPNPENSTTTACLANMGADDWCEVTWQVNATGSRGTTHEFFVIASSDNGNVSTVESPRVNLTIVTPPAGETAGRTAIEQGIQNALGKSSDATVRMIGIRRADGTQQNGTFDKYVSNSTKRWYFNYVTTGESFTNIANLTPRVYMWEASDLTSSQITQQVENFIASTS